MDIQAIRQESRKDPAFEGGNAFTRTLIACGVLTRLGEALPSWITLREIIEKGSSGDINRGKTEFRRLHAEELKRLNAVPDGIPEVLVPVIGRLWSLAVDQATEALVQREEISNERVRKAMAEAVAAQEAAEAARGERDVARAAVEAQKTTLATLAGSLDTERSARAVAEAAAAKAQADAAKQHEELVGVVENSRAELRAAVARLEGAEKHALREIDRTRSESQREIDDLKKLLALNKQTTEELRQELARSRSEISSKAGKLEEVSRDLAVATALLKATKDQRSRPARPSKPMGAAAARKSNRRKPPQ